MSKLFYTVQAALAQDAIPDGAGVRNPHYFRGVEYGVSEVLIEGDWPEIQAAYESAGATVVASAGAIQGDALDDMSKEQLLDLAAERGVSVRANATETALRQALRKAAKA